QSLSYHGFKKIVLLNGHGSNMPNLDLVARRTNLETDAECVLAAWWQLLTVDKNFLPRWRQSKFPGGCAHACELETSLYLYLDGGNVRTDLIKYGIISFSADDSPFSWVDLDGAGPATAISWTSSYSDAGGLGEAQLATAEEGRAPHASVADSGGACHRRMALSRQPEASVLPSGENASAQTMSGWPANVRSGRPLARCHRRTVRSQLPEASVLPSGE